jgi:carbonic anhydrase
MACATHPGSLEHLIHRNRLWASHKTKSDPAFFQRLVAQQRPRYFWIGCSDSRVPATEIVDLDPGEMFVHRNVANLSSEGDPNFEATLSFAVDTLGVDHVIVVGHYGCGGVHAARAPGDGPLGHWLASLHALFKRHQHDLSRLAQGDADNRLCELNVLDQLARLQRHPTILNAWRAGRQLFIHGWVYAIGDGLIADLCAPVSGPNAEWTSS